MTKKNDKVYMMNFAIFKFYTTKNDENFGVTDFFRTNHNIFSLATRELEAKYYDNLRKLRFNNKAI